MSDLFKLNLRDIAKALALTVISAILVSITAIFNEKGFNWTAADLQNILQIAVTTGIAYIIKNYLSDSQGKVFGKI